MTAARRARCPGGSSPGRAGDGGAVIAGSLLGLVRDQSLARLFGAGSDTDAFLVAWTVPEIAATLLIEDGLAIALIPAFSMALARRAGACPATRCATWSRPPCPGCAWPSPR
ncbi:hypothetical protein GCM10023238_00870 [Streptomyces heliomycini]